MKALVIIFIVISVLAAGALLFLSIKEMVDEMKGTSSKPDGLK